MTDTGPLFVSSGDLIADRRYKWALDHAARGDFSGAADILAQTVELAPGFATAWFALGAIRDQLGDRDGAIAAFEKARDADPEDYHGARLQLARLGAGDATPAMTQTYVRRLFDQYSARYDAALTEHLAYRGPALLARGGRIGDARGGAADALRLDARPRLRHRARRRRVSSLRRLARRRRSVAGHDRAGGGERPLRSSRRCRSRRCSCRRGRRCREISSRSRRRRLRLCQRSRADHRRPLRACLRRTASWPSRSRPMPATASSSCRRCAMRTARLMCAPCSRDAGLAIAHLAKTSVRSEKGVPVDSLVVVAQPSTAMRAPASSGE